MYIKTRLFCVITSLILIGVSCADKRSEVAKNTIAIEDQMGNYQTLNLSDYAKSVRYVPLETNDSVLIREIDNIYYEDDRILIYDNSGQCLLFDGNGRFIRNVGHKGQGPDEYLAIRSVNMIPERKQIILNTVPQKLLIYNWDADLIGKYVYPDFDDGTLSHNILWLRDNYFYATTASYIEYRMRGAIIEAGEKQSAIVTEFQNYPVRQKSSTSFSFYEVDKIYRKDDHIRLFNTMNDTIYTVDENFHLQPCFVFDMGKYKTSFEWVFTREPLMDHKYIWPLNVIESNNYIFIQFFFGKHAPEPFEYVKHYSDAEVVTTNHNVHGIFDKKRGKLQLMKQPIKGKIGFWEDIYQASVFWPSYISSDDVMVSYCSAEDFSEMINQHPAPDILKEMKNTIMPDDNQIIILARMK